MYLILVLKREARSSFQILELIPDDHSNSQKSLFSLFPIHIEFDWSRQPILFSENLIIMIVDSRAVKICVVNVELGTQLRSFRERIQLFGGN